VTETPHLAVDLPVRIRSRPGVVGPDRLEKLFAKLFD
jgi:hypothetical protein